MVLQVILQSSQRCERMPAVVFQMASITIWTSPSVDLDRLQRFSADSVEVLHPSTRQYVTCHRVVVIYLPLLIDRHLAKQTTGPTLWQQTPRVTISTTTWGTVLRRYHVVIEDTAS